MSAHPNVSAQQVKEFLKANPEALEGILSGIQLRNSAREALGANPISSELAIISKSDNVSSVHGTETAANLESRQSRKISPASSKAASNQDSDDVPHDTVRHPVMSILKTPLFWGGLGLQAAAITCGVLFNTPVSANLGAILGIQMILAAAEGYGVKRPSRSFDFVLPSHKRFNLASAVFLGEIATAFAGFSMLCFEAATAPIAPSPVFGTAMGIPAAAAAVGLAGTMIRGIVNLCRHSRQGN